MNTHWNSSLRIREICITLICVLLIIPSTTFITIKTKGALTHQQDPVDLFDIQMRILQSFMLSPSLSVCVVNNDGIIFSKGYGYADIKSRRTPDLHTIYPVGSISKTITTTALLQLYEQSLFDLDEDVNNYLPFDLRNPNFPDQTITFRMLLSHRASIFDYGLFTLRGIIYTLATAGIPEDMGSWIEKTLTPSGEWYHPDYWHTDYGPGEEACYSNVGFIIIGYLVELLSGQTIEDYCQQHIFEPLEMDNTSYHPANLNENDLATTYIRRMGLFFPLPEYDTLGFAAIGGVRSSAEDLSHFLIAHLNNGTYKQSQILNYSTIQIMQNCQYLGCKLISPLNRLYGLGWWCTQRQGRNIKGHGGMVPGGSAFMMINESDSMGYIVMTNQFNILGFFSPIKFLLKSQVRTMIGELLFQKVEAISNTK